MEKEVYYECIVCGFKIRLMYPSDYEWNPEKPEECAWDGGVVEKMYMPYGSELDGDIYAVGVCDSCMKKGVDNGRVKIINTISFMRYIDT